MTAECLQDRFPTPKRWKLPKPPMHVYRIYDRNTGAMTDTAALEFCFPINSLIASDSLPQVAEFNTPWSMDAAGECLLYDDVEVQIT